MLSGSDLWGLAAVYGLIALTLLLYALSEGRASPPSRRKLIHIMTGNFVFAWWLFQSQLVMMAFFVLPFLAILLLCHPVRGWAPFRRSMIGEASSQGHSCGLLLYVVSVALMVAFFFDHLLAASMGILAMSCGDGFGSLMGRRFGRRRLVGDKTLEGSLAVFGATAAAGGLMLLFYGFLIDSGHYLSAFTGSVGILPAALAAGGLAALAELLSPGEWDNLVIPLAVALLMTLMGF